MLFISILDPPTQISINPTKIVIEEGQTIMATCLAIGSPEPTYSWYKENSNTMIATGSILEINNAPRSAAGTYTCRATNNYGSNEATVIVDVQCKLYLHYFKKGKFSNIAYKN